MNDMMERLAMLFAADFLYINHPPSAHVKNKNKKKSGVTMVL